jgi:hypothetical protein
MYLKSFFAALSLFVATYRINWSHLAYSREQYEEWERVQQRGYCSPVDALMNVEPAIRERLNQLRRGL